MSPEWIPLLFVAALICLFFLLLRPRECSIHFTIWRVVIVEIAYLGTAYLIFQVFEHPVTEAFFASLAVALAVRLSIPDRVYRRLSGEK